MKAKRIPTVFPFLSIIDESYSHYCGGIILESAKSIATVLPSASYNFGSWFQHLSGIWLQNSTIYIAVVIPLFLLFKFGLWYHYYGGIIVLAANLIATVIPLFSYILGLCSHSLDGIIPVLAYINATV